MGKICLIISISVLAAVCVLSVALVRAYAVAGSLDKKIAEIISEEKIIRDSLYVIENRITSGFSSASKEREKFLSDTAGILEKSGEITASYFMTLSRAVSEIMKSLPLSASGITEEDEIRKLRLMEEGKQLYEDKSFSGSLSIFKTVLGIDPEDAEAEIYASASLYYINPGDGSVYRRIKRSLIPLVDRSDIGRSERAVVLKILEGMCREENDNEAAERYGNLLDITEAVNK